METVRSVEIVHIFKVVASFSETLGVYTYKASVASRRDGEGSSALRMGKLEKIGESETGGEEVEEKTMAKKGENAHTRTYRIGQTWRTRCIYTRPHIHIVYAIEFETF